VIAFQGPGVPPNGMPSDLARGLPDGVTWCGDWPDMPLIIHQASQAA
jgi:hypothetical protein